MAGKKALIAMSGGVDSSVAALLAMRMGYDCIGVTMELIDAPATNDAAQVADNLRIEHHVVDFTKEFKAEVIEPFVSA